MGRMPILSMLSKLAGRRWTIKDKIDIESSYIPLYSPVPIKMDKVDNLDIFPILDILDNHVHLERFGILCLDVRRDFGVLLGDVPVP